MCGIFGCVGVDFPVKKALSGLRRLEYRGYDSAGVCTISNGKISFEKEVGKISVLEEAADKAGMVGEKIALAHTRWATHGKPTKKNAHPHLNESKTVAIVHNGIIENHDLLRAELKRQGIKFISDTDSEVLAHLIGAHITTDLLEAIREVLPLLEGSFAIGVMSEKEPDSVVAFAKNAPLAVGVGEGVAYLASDPNAFPPEIKEVVFLTNGEIALLKAGLLELYDENLAPIQRATSTIERYDQSQSKGDYAHYTLKEIDEQPMAIRNALFNRTHYDFGTATLEGINLSIHELLAVERVLILGCGTSYHAGLIGAQMIEELARVPTQVEIASEYRYSNPIVLPGTLVIAMSQSGETADTVAAVRELKTKGAPVLWIGNVQGSTLAREADGLLYLRAGPEIGVCSTKAFTNQVVVLALFALMMGRMRHLDREEGKKFLDHLLRLPEEVQTILDQKETIAQLAKRYAKFDNFFFLGRRYMYPVGLEAALKLKEISYINANGYPAGELKHGPIALINEECPTVAFVCNEATFSKMKSNLQEVKARHGKILAIASHDQILDGIADDLIEVPSTIDPIAPIHSSVVGQLLAYYIALERGANIDHPRNLAKAVTVE